MSAAASEATGAAPPEIPKQLPVLPLRDGVLFPLAMLPLTVRDERSIQLIDDVMRTHRMVAVIAEREARDPGAPLTPDRLFRFGCAAAIHQMVRGREGGVRIVLQGLERIRVEDFVQTDPYLIARVEPTPVEDAPGLEAEALVRAVRASFRTVVDLHPGMPDELSTMADELGARQLISLVAATTPLPKAERQALLEELTLTGQLRRALEMLQHEIGVREIEQQVTDQTRKQISREQREHLLREQLRSIQRELGEDNPAAAELADLRRKLEACALPAEARREAERELARLEQMPPGAMEFGIARTYLDWLLALPWGKTTGGTIDLGQAKAILDHDHYDLEKIKDRILDYLAVRKLRQERDASVSLTGAGEADHAADAGPLPQTPADEARREPILCFVGPPGVGKTSLGQSIARAMGRRFVRISLGGVHDEGEIRGHRRTYVGAMPGRLVQAMRRAETSDPVFMLDEVDKLAAGLHGSPAAALLEVLDPAQNHAFVDTYLGVPFDLSKVLFICTANTTETIPGPLLDRMELVTLGGYTEQEKLHIARRFLLPKQVKAHGLREGELTIDDEALRRIIREYTREAGVRSLEREIATVARKAARRIGEQGARELQVTAKVLPSLLGRPHYFEQASERVDRPGVATGLAWTPAGGDILFVEAALVPGPAHLVLTGMLGDVMRESAQAALSYVRSNAERLGIDGRAFRGKGVHIHVPAGAIPKDGPSAGVAMMTAIASLARGVPVRNDLAMTGEITLRGKVLPVGGIREKVLAAYRAGIHRVILPQRNESDLEDLAAEVRGEMRFVLVGSAEEVLAEALPSAEAPPLEAQPEMH